MHPAGLIGFILNNGFSLAIGTSKDMDAGLKQSSTKQCSSNVNNVTMDGMYTTALGTSGEVEFMSVELLEKGSEGDQV